MKIITIARKPLSESNVASNVLKHGCGAIDIDSCRIESGTEHHRPPQPTNQERSVFGKQAAFTPTNSDLGRWPSNLLLLGDCPVDEMGRQSGVSSSAIRMGGEGEHLDPSKEGWRFKRSKGGFEDKGTAARFFKQFKVDK